MKFRVRILDMALGDVRILMNAEDAEKYGIWTNSRVRVSTDHKSIVAIVSITSGDIIKRGEIGLFSEASRSLEVDDGSYVYVKGVEAPSTVKYLKNKLRGEELSEEEIFDLINDIKEGLVSDAELAAFVTALEFHGMSTDEIVSLTKAMAEAGNKLEFGDITVFDKHGIGGVPGTSKDTLIIVPIVAEAGLHIPKTSTRAITSPSGTVDTMEVLAPVDLTAEEIVEACLKVRGTIAWTKTANISPVDDILISRVEFPLSLDPEPLMFASILSKKLAASVKNLVLDIPTGEEAKVETVKEATEMANKFREIGSRLGINIEVAISYGGQPVGRAIGPALEAKEALICLMTGGKCSRSIVEKAVSIAGLLLEMGGAAAPGKGEAAAWHILETGKAYERMKMIIREQGGNPDIKPEDIEIGQYKYSVKSQVEGFVTAVSNRAFVEIARAAGAPRDSGAGIYLYVKRGDKVSIGDTLYDIYSSSEARLEEAIKVALSRKPIAVEGMILKVVRDKFILE